MKKINRKSNWNFFMFLLIQFTITVIFINLFNKFITIENLEIQKIIGALFMIPSYFIANNILNYE